MYLHIVLCVNISTSFVLLYPFLATLILTPHHSHPHSSSSLILTPHHSPSLLSTLILTSHHSHLSSHHSHPYSSPLTLTPHHSHPHSSPLSSLLLTTHPHLSPLSPSSISSTLLTLLIISALTAHTPDNSFLGFAVDVDLGSDSQLAKSNLAVVYGKEPYMWKVRIHMLHVEGV